MSIGHVIAGSQVVVLVSRGLTISRIMCLNVYSQANPLVWLLTLYMADWIILSPFPTVVSANPAHKTFLQRLP